MPKKFVPFRLSKDCIDCLAELKEWTGNNKTAIIETAIQVYYGIESDKRRRLYQNFNPAIQAQKQEVVFNGRKQ